MKEVEITDGCALKEDLHRISRRWKFNMGKYEESGTDNIKLLNIFYYYSLASLKPLLVIVSGTVHRYFPLDSAPSKVRFSR